MAERKTKPRAFPFHFILVFLLLTLGIVASGYFYYKIQEDRARKEKENELSEIVKLKTDDLENWRRERYGDALTIYRSPFLPSAARDWFMRPGNEVLRREILDCLRSYMDAYDYSSVSLLDTVGKTHLAVPEISGELQEHVKSHLDEAIRKRKIVFTDFHRVTPGGKIHISLIVPLIPAVRPGDPVGTIVLEIDPSRRLYPFIELWPGISRSSETLLIRRDGNDVVYLNELRHRKGTALSLRFPLSESRRVAVMAVSGKEGIVEGIDYRGVEVLAALRSIPDSPWFLAAKIDREEINEPIRVLARLITVLIGTIIAGAGLIITLIWYRQRVRLIREKHDTELERRFLSQRLDSLSRYANDCILLVDENLRIVDANERALATYGYDREELMRTDLRNLRSPETRPALETQLMGLRESQGAVYETVHRKKDGMIFPVEVSTSAVETEGGTYYQHIVRDITERKQTERALRESEERYRTVSDFTYDWEYWRAPDGKILYISPSCERITGFHPREFIDNPDLLETIVHPDDGHLLKWHKVVVSHNENENEFHEEEFRILRRDGGVRWIGHTCRTIRRDDGTNLGRRATNRDITERKRAEEALRESMERYHRTIDNMLEGCQIIGFDWRYLYVNNVAAAHGRKPMDELLKRTIMETYPGIENTDLFAVLRRCMDERAPAHMENRFTYSDGAEGWFELSIQPVPEGIFILSIDITERKRAEEELRKHREELEELVKQRTEQLVDSEQRLAKESAAVALIVGRMLSGRLTDAESEKHVLGACLEATNSVYGMIGVINDRGTWDTTAYNSRALNDCAFPEALAWDLSKGMDIRGIWGWPLLHGEPLLCNDLRAHPDRVGYPEGHVPIESYLGVPVKREGKVVGMVAVANKAGGYSRADIESLQRLVDIMSMSRRHRELLAEAQATSTELEKRVRERTVQLEAANSELEAFSYSVSHDLRAPLRHLDGFSGILLSDYSDKLDEKGRHYLDRIQESSRRMGQLINDLLDLSRVTRREFIRQRVDLGALARELAAELRGGEPGRQAEFAVAEGMAVDGDANLLRIALENLISNAWKFTGPRPLARIEVGMLEQSGERVYYVRDNGVGFDMAYGDKLFTPFQRLHEAREFPGTGIGLATVQRIISRHGGRVWADAAVDQGATFYFTLGG